MGLQKVVIGLQALMLTCETLMKTVALLFCKLSRSISVRIQCSDNRVVMRFYCWAGKRGPYPGYTEGSVATGETRRLSLDSELKQGGNLFSHSVNSV